MLELRNISVGYAAPVLQGVSFAARPGTLTALVGRNGCGKTTLLRAMAGQQPFTGEILLDGRSLRDYKRKELAQHLAFLPQARTVPDIRVQNLVEHGRFPYLGFSRRMTPQDHDAVALAMEQAGVTAWQDRYLNELSGGQRQRVYLAMALAQGGQTLLLDEPMTYLDAAAQFRFLELLRSLAAQGRTIVLVLHDLAQALQYCNAVAVLDGGQLSAFDAPAAIYAQKALDPIFRVTLCRTEDDVYYIRPDRSQAAPSRNDA